jgi:ADP-ribose pyrophosphatase YjhB (NUDIX family)
MRLRFSLQLARHSRYAAALMMGGLAMGRGIMISLETSAGSFNVRTVGVAIHDDQVLLHRAVHDTWWALPGGRVEMHESSADALLREMREEMGVEVELRHLLWVMERFYLSSRRHHSIQFYYLMQVPEALLPASAPTFTSPESNDTPLVFQWQQLADLESLAMPLYPAALCTLLQRLPETVIHLVAAD